MIKVSIVDKTTEEYLNYNSLYSDMYGFLNENGIFAKNSTKLTIILCLLLKTRIFKCRLDTVLYIATLTSQQIFQFSIKSL